MSECDASNIWAQYRFDDEGDDVGRESDVVPLFALSGSVFRVFL